MKILLVGGSGMVGTFLAPYLIKEGHELRVLDVNQPTAEGVEYHQGSISDPDAVRKALTGCDTFINLVMQGRQGGDDSYQTIELIQSNYEVNTLGLHLVLYIAQEMGIKHGLHTSTMTVHYRDRRWYWQEEFVPRDTPSVYGVTKALGEQICEYFARWFDMNIIALRITVPRTREDYLAERRARPADFDGPKFVLDEEDLAAAYIAALRVVQVGHGRFDAVFLSGDELEQHHNQTKARQLLGWEPQSQQYVTRG
ncbi:NAD-dependent epimerase/dehydratase family protein [Jiangella asiatica]|uniref:NAD(P)-dependent oxidoreductase n=1 Tax=Jiangella asiatica TaxID=2530372 RepID=A0A4R5D6N2_9ACTN|nr:NAD(P)-dependent oxidoreductase [Jiangella asiatica]TDE08257.1 NAD(P)-dependent oxidoreductase [Jiangella asiatica]